jgi:CRP-like cAMP-binding protein
MPRKETDRDSALTVDIHVLIRKLDSLHAISDDEKMVIVDALSQPVLVKRGSEITAEGSSSAYSTLLLTGFAFRHKDLADGRRQILSINYPGDFVDLSSHVLKRTGHSVSAASECKVAYLAHTAVLELGARYPNIQAAIWRNILVDASILEMWLVNTGRRAAAERIAHFICEQFVRMRATGLAKHSRILQFPLTQTDVADATGLSLVHVNKSIRVLRERGWIGPYQQQLEILDWTGLQRFAGFDPAYLHNLDLEYVA